MVEWWWGLIGAALPAVAVQQVWRVTRRKAEEEGVRGGSGAREKGGVVGGGPAVADDNNVFVCERVCTSKRMLNKIGAFAKDPNPSNTCVTVCGASQVDACSEACARSVCSNQHHIPNWNDICLRRCQNQCLQLQPASP